jgi:TolB-like protein
MAEIDPNAVRALVARISASSGFVNSDRLCRFLRFTVDVWLAGDGDQIKEYVVAREVFDRAGEYDPRTDPIVRVEARRLRRKLDEYFAAAGRAEPLRLSYPKGSYLPQVTPAEAGMEPPAAPPAPQRRTWLMALPAALVLALGGWLIWTAAAARPKVLVLPARWVWASDEFTQTPLDVDLAERVAAQLANRHGINVVAWPTVQSASHGAGKARELARQLGAAHSLLVAVRVEALGTRVTTYLIDTATERKMHVTDKEGQDLANSAQREQAAAAIAGEVAGALR